MPPQDIGSVGSGALEGAGAGSFLGPPGAIGGAIVGGVASFLGGRAEDQQRQQRYADYVSLIRRLMQEERQRAQTAASGMVKQQQASAARRAVASGRPGDIESNVLPAVRGAAIAGNESVRSALRPYYGAEIQAGAEFADRPIQPSGWDYLATTAGTLGQYAQQRDYLGMMRGIYGKMPKSPYPDTNVYGEATPADWEEVTPKKPS